MGFLATLRAAADNDARDDECAGWRARVAAGGRIYAFYKHTNRSAGGPGMGPGCLPKLACSRAFIRRARAGRPPVVRLATGRVPERTFEHTHTRELIN